MLKSSVLVCLLALAVPAAAYEQSLIDPDHYRGLSSDRRAYQLGDTLTVLVLESTTAESAAGTGAKSSTGIAAKANSITRDHKAGLELDGDTSGAGQTSRRGQIRTNVAVRVVEVLPEGLLRVKGEQTVTVNDEKQHVNISGLVRTDDISYENTVLSYRLADARIDIVGDGVVNDAQKQNIFFRVLKWLRVL